MYFETIEAVYTELRSGSPHWQLDNFAEACAEVANASDPRALRLGALGEQLQEL
jgi:hypothetical protein